jgi:hypothetical protein
MARWLIHASVPSAGPGIPDQDTPLAVPGCSSQPGLMVAGIASDASAAAMISRTVS